MKFPWLMTVLALLAAALLSARRACASKFYWHRHTTTTRCCLPDRDYGKTEWPFTEPRRFGNTAFPVAGVADGEGDLGRETSDFHALALVGIGICRHRL
jgi:hypothetical protein